MGQDTCCSKRREEQACRRALAGLGQTQLFPQCGKDQRAASYPSFVPGGTAAGVTGEWKAVGNKAHKSPSPGASPSIPEPMNPCRKWGAGAQGRWECTQARLPCASEAAGRQQKGLEIAASLTLGKGSS